MKLLQLQFYGPRQCHCGMDTPLVSDHTVIYCTQYSILVVKSCRWVCTVCAFKTLAAVKLDCLQILPTFQRSFIRNTSQVFRSACVLRTRYKTWSKGENAALQIFKKPLNTLYKEEVPLELWVCRWFTLWTAQCKQQGHQPFLCFYKTIAVSSVLLSSPNSGYAACNDISLTVCSGHFLLIFYSQVRSSSKQSGTNNMESFITQNVLLEPRVGPFVKA